MEEGESIMKGVQHNPNDSIIKIGRNTAKRPGDLKKPSANAGVKNSKE